MAGAFAGAAGLAVATRTGDELDLELPSEWTAVSGVSNGDGYADTVVVGPNGVFSIGLDHDPGPATPAPDGIYRNGRRVTEQVKRALLGAHRLRSQLALPGVAYPILVMPLAGSASQLDRLGVLPGSAIPEYIWSHPGWPLRRSERLEILWRLKRPAP